MKKVTISKNKNSKGYTALFYNDNTNEPHFNDVYQNLEDVKKDCEGYKIIIKNEFN